MHLLILDPLAEEYKKALEPKFPQLSIEAATREEEIEETIENADILFASRISDELIRRAVKLKWIQAKPTGVDAFTSLPSLRRDVLITSTRGIHGPQMSEMAILLMLAFNRDLPRNVRNRDQRIWERWPGKLLYQKKVGILGVGAIGEEIARKCKAFHMTVYGIDVIRREVDAVDFFYGPEDLLSVLRVVDYFIIVVPHTPETEKMIGREALAAMKPTAFLINIGRGRVMDENALIDALKNGRIAGAALDTFWTEPLPKEHPFWEMKNVILTPHIGGLSDIYMEQALPILEENLRRFLSGERKNLINLVTRPARQSEV